MAGVVPGQFGSRRWRRVLGRERRGHCAPGERGERGRGGERQKRKTVVNDGRTDG